MITFIKQHNSDKFIMEGSTAKSKEYTASDIALFRSAGFDCEVIY